MNELSLYEKVPPLENNFSVKFKEYHHPNGLLPHWHEHLELLYFISGECELIIGGKEVTARPGDLAIANQNEIHSFTSKGDVRYYCILIYPSFFSDVNFEGIKLNSLISADEFVKECFRNMSVENKSNTLDSRLMIKSHTLSLLAHLVRLYTEHPPTEEELGRSRALLERFSKIADYVANNYTQDISTADLAAMCFVSENHFCRFFKKMTGKSAISYLNEYRIERAAALLLGTDATIAEIASSVGLSDPNYFTRIFTRLKGKSPQSFRKAEKSHVS